MRVENLDVKIAKNLIAFRKSLNLSQRQFALRANIDQAHLNKIENSKMSVTFTILQKISGTYGIPIKSFFEFSDQEKNKTKNEIIMILESFNKEHQLKFIRSFLREFKKFS